MTKARDLDKGDRVIYWREERMGPGKTPVNSNPQHQGTVVSVDPLRVLWDTTYADHSGPPMEFPLYTNGGYERFEIKALPRKK